MSDIPRRATSAPRIAGDDYQHLVTLNEVLSAMRGNGASTLTVEASNAGNVDDVVVHYIEQPPRFTQIKHAVDGQTPVGYEWLTKPTRAGGKSLLQRFYASWENLGGTNTRPHLQLITDRDIDPHDPILKTIDRKTNLVMPAAGARHLSELRTTWAGHLGIDDDELKTFLSDLHFVPGRSFNLELERAGLFLETLGLNSGQTAIDSGLALVREWVQERERTLAITDLASTVEARIGRRSDPGALLVIEGIDDAPSKGDADIALRFVERYEGKEPFERRKLISPNDWQTIIWPQLTLASAQLREAGHSRVVVDGAMRLPMWFGAGAALRHVLGFNVAVRQRGQVWSSDDKGTPPPLTTSVTATGSGQDLAVALGIASDPTSEVEAHIESDSQIGRLLRITPSGGTSNESIPDGPTATALAEAVRDLIRAELSPTTDEIHLFLATPAGLALLLGHRWNALRPTTVYEHLGAGRGYQATFVVPS
jgi:hypothetical protein